MTDDRFPITELTPEQAALFRRQYEIDYAETGPKAPVSQFVYRGVSIASRWAVAAELETMKQIIDAIPELTVRRIDSIWCDSNCGANYLIGIRTGFWVPSVASAVSDAIMAVCSGHNGVFINEGNVRRAELDPDWNEV